MGDVVAGCAPVLPVRGRDGRWSGELPVDVVREIARRLQTGERYDAISAALGLSRKTGRRKCAEIALALQLPPERSQYEQDLEEVARRTEAGEMSAEIAQAMGRSVDSVRQIKRKLGHGRPRPRLLISAEENAEIERQLLAGESTRTVAAAVGCEQASVHRRLKRIRHQISSNRPACHCGKPKGHRSRCNLIVDPALVRERLLAGFTATDIAREFGRTAPSFRLRYVDPVIAELTAEGHRCECGRALGHQVACPRTNVKQRISFSTEQRSRTAELVKTGASVAKVRAALGITTSSANVLVAETRAILATAGVLCPCGDLIDHSRTCVARNGETHGRTSFQFRSAAANSMAKATRATISKRARAGQPISMIMARTRETEWRVTQLVDELGAAGLLPTECSGCGQPYRHKGPCPKPKLCRCGRPRKHRGLCRRADGRKRVPETKLSIEQLAEVKRQYRNRSSIRAISRSTGISFAVVQRQIKRWREASRQGHTPCACGRPAWHGGSCWVNRSDRVGKRHLARIEQALAAGQTSHRIAERLGLGVMTVLKHAVPIRARLFAQGVTCACGRPVGHNHWCSAKWDAFDQPRGRRPFPEPQETLAVEALLRGEVVADIAKAASVSPDSIWRLRLSLTDDQRADRARAVRARIARGPGLQGEALMARIQASVSKRLDPVLRDDVVGELYLAVLEGRLEVEQLGAAVKSFVNRGLSEWQSAYGPRSLDQKLFSDGSRTLGDLIEDRTAICELDGIEIGNDG